MTALLDPSVGLRGMNEGKRALANAIIDALSIKP